MAENDGNSGAVDEVAEVNAAATAELEQSQKDAAEAASKDKGTPETPEEKATDKTPGQEQTFDAQKRYEDLDKRYKDLQREFTPLSQERAKSRQEVDGLKKQVEQFAEALAEATKTPFDIEQFKRDFAAQGPKALDSYFDSRLKKEIEKVKQDYDARLAKSEERYTNVASNHEVLIRANNEKDYPDFVKLYPLICELAKPESQTKIDFNREIGPILDDLYKLAKERSSEEALRIATEEAKKKAEADAARESDTTVATGGKARRTSNPDLETMPLDKLEQLVLQQHGVADRG
jgi:hypothetical protein